MLQTKLDVLKERESTLNRTLTDTQRSIEFEQMSRRDTPERRAALRNHAELQSRLANLQKERQQYGASDPVQIAAKRRAVELAQEAAIRHTDNTLAVIAHLRDTCGIDPKELRAHLEINDDWDDI